jgi:hypothetical protein
MADVGHGVNSRISISYDNLESSDKEEDF